MTSGTRAARDAPRRRTGGRVGGCSGLSAEDESALLIESTAMPLTRGALHQDDDDSLRAATEEASSSSLPRLPELSDGEAKHRLYNEAMERSLNAPGAPAHAPADDEEKPPPYDVSAAVSLGVLSSDESLAVELNKRVRELTAQAEVSETEKHRQWRQLESKIGDLQSKVSKFQRRFDDQQKVAYEKDLEIKDLRDQLKRSKRRVAQLQMRFVALELKSNKGWSEVGDRNLQLQRTRRIELNRKVELDKERERRVQAIRERDAMARSLRPLRQKNMEIQYALQLKEEEVRKMRSGEGKLQATLDNEKQYAERMERQAQNLAQERTMVLEDASRKHLQLQELHEDVNELMDNLCQEQNLRHDLEVRMYSNESQLAAAETRILKMEGDLRRERETAADCRRDVESREGELMMLRMELMDARRALELEQETTNVSRAHRARTGRGAPPSPRRPWWTARALTSCRRLGPHPLPRPAASNSRRSGARCSCRSASSACSRRCCTGSGTTKRRGTCCSGGSPRRPGSSSRIPRPRSAAGDAPGRARRPVRRPPARTLARGV